jgi:hypothetical protein
VTFGAVSVSPVTNICTQPILLWRWRQDEAGYSMRLRANLISVSLFCCVSVKSYRYCLQGQDSVGAALAFGLFEMARHPDVQERAVQELDEVFGGDTRTPNLSDLRRLKYLEQCIKETLRLYPSVPILSRTLSQDANIGISAAVHGVMLSLPEFANLIEPVV